MSHSLSAPSLMNTFQSEISLKSSDTCIKSRIEECLWALDYPELQKACFLARICQVKPPLHCRFCNVLSILQSGPTCGITALSMLLNGSPTIAELLEDAQRKQFTNNGEMFSARNLFQLICDNLPFCNAVTNANNIKAKYNCSDRNCKIECEMHEGRLNCAKVKETICQGACIFVPYDTDFNHSPCLKFGHKSHWALIIGYLINDNDEFYVLARHGKSKNLAVWSLQALSDSNSNLMEFAQPNRYLDCDFLLPPGGIGGDLGLRERAIIVKGLPHQILTIR
ncbi:UPF0692 protein CG33108 [Glossina fuscipes]|uniref:Actin maturation protease n=1 Tax=Glossina fuscipes TaxID=7396 RepID=A0A8U0WJB7_9MUSC|nr:UPF0692 protein CG33108 [Glossina fuscipes]KAI9584257.1 hypothetical protein GQX74_006152 [Glossina fuscipes]